MKAKKKLFSYRIKAVVTSVCIDWGIWEGDPGTEGFCISVSFVKLFRPIRDDYGTIGWGVIIQFSHYKRPYSGPEYESHVWLLIGVKDSDSLWDSYLEFLARLTPVLHRQRGKYPAPHNGKVFDLSTRDLVGMIIRPRGGAYDVRVLTPPDAATTPVKHSQIIGNYPRTD